MVFPKARLVVSGGLFLTWIGFLVYLVARTRDPVILSRPQLVVASAVVVADIQEKDGRPMPTVTIKRVAWALGHADPLFAGTPLIVDGLADCGPGQGWKGPGEYILPLTKRKPDSGNTFEVTPLPLSPGYAPQYVTVELVQTGPDKEKVAELVDTLFGRADKKGDIPPGVLRRNVPRLEAESAKRKLEAAKAVLRITEGEERIYRATPDVLEQLEEQRTRH
jgi:hypothetical protein